MREITEGALLEELRAWVEIESPTDRPDQVNKLADLAEARLRAMGAAIERTPGRDGCGDILIGRIPGEANGPGVLLLGHLDTVHAVGTLAAHNPWRVEGGRAWGPGAYDMKGGNVIAFAALAHLHATGRRPRLPVTVMMIPDEEIGSPTSREAIEAEGRRARLALVVEPSGGGGALTVARHGMARYVLRTTGVPAHAGAEHEKGRSAIREMAAQILAIEAMTDHARDVTLNVGTVVGGTFENMVPMEARATVYCRVPTAADEAEVRGRLMALRPVFEGTGVEVTPGIYRPAFGVFPAIVALYEHAAGLARELGFEVAGQRIAGGGSDGNFTGALGVPTLDGLGIIGGGPHTHEEYVDVASMVPRCRLLLRLFETLGPDTPAFPA